MSSKFKVDSSKPVLAAHRSAFRFSFLILGLWLLAVFYSLPVVSADEKTRTTATAGKSAIAVTRAERNVQADTGQFNVRLERVPADPRAGENSQFAVRIAEKVEGGFGGGEPIVLEDAVVSANITTADGASVAGDLPTKFENGFYRGSYVFADNGNFKLVFNVMTVDNRYYSVDFPVSVTNAPVNRTFWVGLIFLAGLALGTVGAVFYAGKRRGNVSPKRLAPVAIAAVLIFALGTFALAYFAPPRQSRSLAQMPPIGTGADSPAAEIETASVLQTSLTVPKESQILFGIKTEPVAVRQITSGLKTTGVARARPDARAIVVPPVSGRIVLRAGITLGSAVTRGERIGTVEQILDVSGQTELESQRLEVEAQQREIESQRLQIRNTVLQLQAQQAEQRASAAQAGTQLAQARRELRRAENLLEAGAVPKKRVEEAQTAVRVAEQSLASAEQQARLLENQIKQANAGQNIFRNPRVNQPTRSFALTAPITGIVSEIKATSGQIAETGAELLSIVNLSTVLIEAQVFEKDLPAIRESTRASFTSPALAGEIYTAGTPDGDGRLVSVGQIVDPQTRAVPVIYEVKNPLGRLRDGNFVEITIDTTGDRKVLAVPKPAVVTEQGQTFVFVFNGGESFEKRPVALGAEGADFYEVNSGLKEGDRIVTEGVYQLRSTQPGA